jgi:hypothetical protein
VGFKADKTQAKQTTQTKQLPFVDQGWRLTLVSKCPSTVTSIMRADKSLVPSSGQAQFANVYFDSFHDQKPYKKEVPMWVTTCSQPLPNTMGSGWLHVVTQIATAARPTWWPSHQTQLHQLLGSGQVFRSVPGALR